MTNASTNITKYPSDTGDQQRKDLAAVYKDWLNCVAKTECDAGGLSDDEMSTLIDQRWNLYHKAVNLSANAAPGYVTAWKVRMLEYETKWGEPCDNRHCLMLASIRADLEC